MASAGPSEARTQGGGVAGLLTRLRDAAVAPCPPPPAWWLSVRGRSFSPSPVPSARIRGSVLMPFSPATLGAPGSGAGQLSLTAPPSQQSSPASAAERPRRQRRHRRILRFADTGDHHIEGVSPSSGASHPHLRQGSEQEHEVGRAPRQPKTQQNLCTASSGNTCQAGTPGSAPGPVRIPQLHRRRQLPRWRRRPLRRRRGR